MNGHWCLVGPSGAGKTTRLRRMISQMTLSDPDVKVHVLDVHGDMVVDGEDSLIFKMTAPYGLNPLRIDADEDFGGVLKRVRHFLSLMSRSSSPLGSKQMTTLQNLLIDMYEEFGFFAEESQTWSLAYDPRPQSRRREEKRQVHLGDLKAYAEKKLTAMKLGTNGECVNAIEDLNRAARSLQRAEKRFNRGEDVNIDKLRERCLELFNRYIMSVDSGTEIHEVLRYDSQDTIQSVYNRIQNLEQTGIFKSQAPPFDPMAQVWRYNMQPLEHDERQMMVDTLVESIFAEARLTGRKPYTDTWIVIDEAHLFVSPDDADHILTKVSKEARKFGLGLILSSQALDDFPDEIISNMATKYILGVDGVYRDKTARKLKVDSKRLADIQVQVTALVQIQKRGGQGSSEWFDLILG